MRLRTLGRIASGNDTGWFVWIERGAFPLAVGDGEVGYVTYINPLRDFSGDPTWFAWHGTEKDVERSLQTERRTIEWLDDPPPARFAKPP